MLRFFWFCSCCLAMNVAYKVIVNQSSQVFSSSVLPNSILFIYQSFYFRDQLNSLFAYYYIRFCILYFCLFFVLKPVYRDVFCQWIEIWMFQQGLATFRSTYSQSCNFLRAVDLLINCSRMGLLENFSLISGAATRL